MGVVGSAGAGGVIVKRAWGGVWLALLCAACAAHGAVSPSSQSITEFVPLSQRPVGYYPGIGRSVVAMPDLGAWEQSNRQGIDDMQNRVKAVKEGRATAGCLKEDKYNCVAALAQRFAVADSYFLTDANLFSPRRYDVNGKPMDLHIELWAFVPKAKPDSTASNLDKTEKALLAMHNATKFSLQLDRDGSVAVVKVGLPSDPTFAHTQEQYDATNVYEMVAALTARSCPALERTEVAKWVENTIKPSATTYKEKIHRGVGVARIANKAKLCGRSFQFDSLWAKQTYNQFRIDETGGMFVAVE